MVRLEVCHEEIEKALETEKVEWVVDKLVRWSRGGDPITLMLPNVGTVEEQSFPELKRQRKYTLLKIGAKMRKIKAQNTWL